MAKSSFQSIVGSSTPTLIDFYATWCGPCKAFAPTLNQLKKKVGEQARIIKIDIDKNPSLATKLNVKSVPTLMIYKDGKQVWRESGGQTLATLESKLSELY